MRIATRLVLTLGVVATAVMSLYGVIAQRQKQALLSDALARETDMLARTVQIVTNNALRDRRFADLGPVLARVIDDPETLAVAALDAGGGVLAGGPASALRCLEEVLRDAPPDEEAAGWIDCGERIRWAVLPVRPPAARVVIARRAEVVERELSTSRRRILVTTLVLAAAAALAILVVLRRTLSQPLEAIMRGVRALGGPRPPEPIRVSRSGGELADLAAAFNEMAERLEGKRRTLIRETEERVGLERRLRQSEKFAALGRFTGGVAHELGSPLNVIGVRAEAVAADPDATPAIRRQAEEILGEVERVAELVRGLRHVAKRHSVETRPVDIAEVARDVAGALEPVARAASVALRLLAPDEPVRVDGDATLLRHALRNLTLNALQALAERGPGGSGGSGEPRGSVTLVVERADDGARVIVEDDGPGIAPEHVPRLFEPFFTTREVGQGMGLGLPVTLGIVEEHGGALHIEPREGGGVRAVVELPAAVPAGGGS